MNTEREADFRLPSLMRQNSPAATKRTGRRTPPPGYGRQNSPSVLRQNGPSVTVILNGNFIKVTTQESSKLSTEYDIAPFAHTVKYLDGPPDGTVATDYSKLIGTQKKDITFMQDLLDMTSGAFVTVVIAALGFNPLGAFAAGVLLGKICHIGGTVHPDGIHAISVRVLSYQRPSGPGVIGYGTVTKLYTKWYASANQQNYIEDADTVVYRCMNG